MVLATPFLLAVIHFGIVVMDPGTTKPTDDAKSTNTSSHQMTPKNPFSTLITNSNKSKSVLQASRDQDLSNQTAGFHAHLHHDVIFKTNSSIEEIAMGESEYFIYKIFQKYGSQNTLNLEGLRNLMTQLGLHFAEDEENMASHENQREYKEHGNNLEMKIMDNQKRQNTTREDLTKRSVKSMAHVETVNHKDSLKSLRNIGSRFGQKVKRGDEYTQKLVERMADSSSQKVTNVDNEDIMKSMKSMADSSSQKVTKVDNKDRMKSVKSMAASRSQKVTNSEGDDRLKALLQSMARRRRHGMRRRSVEHVITIHNHSDHSECHPLTDLLSAFHFDFLTDLDPDKFLLLCPALIDQLSNSGCRHHHHSNHLHDNSKDAHISNIHDHDGNHSASDESSDVISGMTSLTSRERKGISTTVWMYSFVSVLVLSLVGLLGVAAIPLIQRVFYKSLLQFLIALAVGALSGDALLHLIPHALSPSHDEDDDTDLHHRHNTTTTDTHNHQTKENHDHRALVWKGLTALLCLLFFFVAERLLTIVTHAREVAKLKRRASKKSRLLELTTDTTTDHVIDVITDASEETTIRETAILSDDDDDDYNNDNDNDDHHHHHHHNSTNNNKNNNHQHQDQGHSQGQGHAQGHGHGHSHCNVPDSVSAVALMVILGDGIHNFSDGLAIGAAFANSITGGLSTTVAVFCHELPHEIGDFAMLLSSGMPWRRAMMYNVLSSCLCMAGMVVGVFLGHLDNAVLWIFSAVAGMFLYISLADMLPELKVTTEAPGRQLMVQCLGMGLGSGIMLVIAVFEEDLKNMLG